MRTTRMLVVALLGSGCVSQSTFDALKTERDGLDATLGEKNKALAELEAKQNKVSAKNAELDAALKDEQEKVRDLTLPIDKPHADMAATAKDKTWPQAPVPATPTRGFWQASPMRALPTTCRPTSFAA